MVRPRALSVAVVSMLAVAPATSRAAPDARITGTFSLSGRVTVADHVRGERRGQRVTRHWTFASHCVSGPCRSIRVRRRRGGGRSELVTLRRTAPGVYSGTGRFYVRLRCHGRVYPRGGVAPYRLSVRVLAARRVQTTRFATRVHARYRNDRRVNRTPCPGGIGHDAARYSGGLRDVVPGPPAAAFAFARPNPLLATFTFADTSRPGAGGAPIVAFGWNFGDPGSGAADVATSPRPSHTFSSPGSHTVTLVVRDANGLTGTVAHVVTF